MTTEHNNIHEEEMTDKNKEQDVVEEELELKVDVINYLSMLANSTFKDVLTFMDEIKQNATRGEAKNLYITHNYNDKTLIFENDGEVLTEPQVLFHLSKSGWSEKVKEKEEPYGTGFFSVITVSNLIKVRSGYYEITFDVDKTLMDRKSHIKQEKVEEYLDGFRVTLHNFDPKGVYYSDIEERTEMLAKYDPTIHIYFNDELKEPKSLTEGDNSPFQTSIELPKGKEDLYESDEPFIGWLSLNPYYSHDVKVFYKGRMIRELHEVAFLKGEIHINDKILTLKQPDRKEIIQNQKLDDFIAMIRLYGEMLAEEALTSDRQDEIERHKDAIARFVNKEKIKKKMRFLSLKGKNEKDLSFLDGVAIAIRKKGVNQIRSMNDYNRFVKEERRKELEKQKELEKKRENEQSHETPYETVNEINVEIQVKKKVPKAKGIVEHEGYSSSGSYKPAYTERPEINLKQTVEKGGEVLFKEDFPTFWMTFEDIIEHEKKFNIVKHYDLKLVIARNKIEGEILKAMKNENILHISELQSEVKIVANVTTRELTKKEKRANMLFNYISQSVIEMEDVFVIGEVLVTKKTEIESIHKSFEEILENVTVVCNEAEGKVYIDRSIIETSIIDEEDGDQLTVNDYKFLLRHIDSLTRELSMVSMKNENLLNKTLELLAV